MEKYKIGFFDWLFNKDNYIDILYYIYLCEKYEKSMVSEDKKYWGVGVDFKDSLLNNLLSANLFYMEDHTGKKISFKFDNKNINRTQGVLYRLTDKGKKLLLKNWRDYWNK
jgi:hypothetical protein